MVSFLAQSGQLGLAPLKAALHQPANVAQARADINASSLMSAASNHVWGQNSKRGEGQLDDVQMGKLTGIQGGNRHESTVDISSAGDSLGLNQGSSWGSDSGERRYQKTSNQQDIPNLLAPDGSSQDLSVLCGHISFVAWQSIEAFMGPIWHVLNLMINMIFGNQNSEQSRQNTNSTIFSGRPSLSTAFQQDVQKGNQTVYQNSNVFTSVQLDSQPVDAKAQPNLENTETILKPEFSKNIDETDHPFAIWDNRAAG